MLCAGPFFGSGMLKWVIRGREENIMHTLVFGARGTWADLSSVLDSVPSLALVAAARDCHTSGQAWWLPRGWSQLGSLGKWERWRQKQSLLLLQSTSVCARLPSSSRAKTRYFGWCVCFVELPVQTHCLRYAAFIIPNSMHLIIYWEIFVVLQA